MRTSGSICSGDPHHKLMSNPQPVPGGRHLPSIKQSPVKSRKKTKTRMLSPRPLWRRTTLRTRSLSISYRGRCPCTDRIRRRKGRRTSSNSNRTQSSITTRYGARPHISTRMTSARCRRGHIRPGRNLCLGTRKLLNSSCSSRI